MKAPDRALVPSTPDVVTSLAIRLRRIRWRSPVLILLALATLVFAAPSARAQGITQPTFTSAEVGKIFFTFPSNSVGGRVTIADFQHGQLYMASGSFDAPVRDSWWNVSSLATNRTPVLIQSQNTAHDKSHDICFWKSYFTEACNGTTLHVWDFFTRAQVGSVNGTVNSLWDCVQAPYAFTGSHGYGTGTLIEVWNVNNPASIVKIGQVDTGTTPGFQVGTVQALGNLLLCGATEAPGVAVYDISDPANPILLDSRVDGTNHNYTSLIYGSRFYNCERQDIRVYDFSDPTHIQMIGTIATGGTPRYVFFKDGKGYCATGNANVKVFDAQTLAITQTFSPDGQIMDLSYPIGNMLLVAGGGAGGNSTNGARLMALQQNPDTTGPTVVYGLPTNNAVNVPLSSRIGFSMSDMIDVESMTTNTFIVRPVGASNGIDGTYTTMTGLINFSPAQPLLPGTTYEVILTAGGVKDIVGNGIAAQYRTTFTTFAPAIGADGLNHRWPLDGNINDTIGGNSGSNTGITFTNGVAGQAGLFNGAAFANVGSIDFSNSFTLASWVWVDSTATNIQTVLANSSGGTANGFRFFVNTYNTADHSVLFETGNGTANKAAHTGTGVVTAGAWNHLAVVVDRVAGTANIYVNGTNKTTTSAVFTNFNTAAIVNLGQFTNNSFRLSGRLDEVRTYNRQLTTAEIGDLQTVAHKWQLDGDFTDVAGSNNGVNSGVTFTNAARVGTQAGVYNGSSYVDVGAINLGNQFSLAAWVWEDTTATNIQTIMANTTGGSTSNGFRFFVNTYNTANGAVMLETGNGTAGNNAGTSAGVFAPGAWNHVAVTVDRTAGMAAIYVNGANVTTDSSILTNFNNNAGIQLGQMTNAGFRLHGRLDDVRIYNKVISAADVANLINASGNSLPVISSISSSSEPSLANSSVTFTINATDADNDALSYSFDFGDGSGQGAFTLNKSASHTYTSPGRYTVFGRVKDAVGTVTASTVQIVHLPLTATNAVASAQIIYDASRNKVWNVNPDSDTVTRIDATALTKDFEIAVGAKPRTLALRPGNAEIWVTCESSDQIYILSATNGVVLQTLSTPRGSRPMAVAFPPDGSAAYVTYMHSGLLAKWNSSTRTQTSTLDVGSTPRPLAISGDSTRIFVGRFTSPVNPFNPGAEVGEVREVAASTFTVTRTFTLAHDLGPDTETSSRGTPNYLLQMAITPDGQRLFVPSKKDNVDRGTFRDGNGLLHDRTVRSIFSKLDLVNNVEATGERVDIDNSSLIHGVAFSPMGDVAFLALQGNNEVLVFNAYTGSTVAGFGLGSELSPQDLVMKPDGTRLFVLNFMTRSVSAFDVSGIVNGTSSSATQLAVIDAVTTEKLSAQVLLGKQIFYNAADTRMSAEGYLSCASCHLDGGHDGRVWDFTDRGEGLRNTITLIGHNGTNEGNVHWTANFDEIQDFELDIRNAFAGTGFITNGVPNSSLGSPNGGRSAELDALAAYVASLGTSGKSPYRNSDGTLTPDAVAGRQLFAQLNCASCHAGPAFTDSVDSTNNFVLHDVGTLNHPGAGQRLGGTLTGFDTPSLKGLWATGPYLHDGSAATLLDVITTQNTNNQHGVTTTLTSTQQAQLVAYLQQIDALEVGGISHLWPFDNTVNDVVGTNNGTATSLTYTNGQVNQAGYFNGSASVSVGAITFSNSFTIAGWVWIDSTATNIQTVMANAGGGASTAGFRFFVNTWNTKDGALNFETGDGTTGNSGRSTTNAVTFGAWNHLAAVVNRTSGQVTFYANGNNVSSDTSIITNFTVNSGVYLGQMSNGVYRLHGRLDEMAIYNRALSSTDITVLYSGDAALSGSGGSSLVTFMQPASSLTLDTGSPAADGGSSNTLPVPWQSQDVGVVGVTGSAGFTNGTFTINGSGADIWGTADGFNYLFQSASGDCDIRTRVVNVADTSSGAKAGVMIRESLSENAAHASTVITPGKGAWFERRAGTGATTSRTSLPTIKAPYWVRVQRSGDNFTSWISRDGVSWLIVGSAKIPMGTNVYIGLGVTSQNDGTLNTSSFDNVTAVP